MHVAQLGRNQASGPAREPRWWRTVQQALRKCSSAIAGLVLKVISLGTPALRRRVRSVAHSFGR
jgi:hypothetical protein